MKMQDWIYLARDRSVPDLLDMPRGLVLNLGQGNRPIDGAIGLDKEMGWNADRDVIPYGAESISGIWMHGMLCYCEYPVKVLAECQRVLRPGGVLNIVDPHASSDLWNEDIYRKTRLHEETWKNLFKSPWYDPQVEEEVRVDQLDVHACFIFGVVFRNLTLFTQLVKRA